MNKDNIINFAIDPTFFLKVGETTFGLDKKLLTRNSEELSNTIMALRDDQRMLDFSDDYSLTEEAFSVVMMFYYTPSWCTFNINKEHFNIIWQIVYACNKFGFTKFLNEVEKYLIENCNYLVETLKVSSNFKLKNLKKKCLTFLATNSIPEEQIDLLSNLNTEDLISLIRVQNQFITKNKGK